LVPAPGPEPIPSVVVGTAGHVDHGKTELVKALTGINTDRLAEEQERELSIDIGFAHLDLPDGLRIGIVDVPGHERFIKNMLAGATGIDLVMLVVAADEGVMPQTREHLDIINLLGIETGITVITKCDLVDEEFAGLVEEEIRAHLAGTPLSGAPVVRTSARTGEGLDELVAVLSSTLGRVEPRDTTGPARLPIDRVFTAPGFGVVVTGTLVRGRLALGDSVEVLPGAATARVRGLQVHGSEVGEVTAARRVAVNLARLSREGVARGDTLCAPGSMKASGMLDVRLELLRTAPRPLKQRTRIRLHHGTAELLGRVYLLEGDVLEPGASCYAQLRLEQPVAATRGDRFVIRSYSPMTTIGGGSVLDPTPRRHRRRDAAVAARLEDLEAGDSTDVALQWIRERERPLFTARDLATALQLDLGDGEAIVQQLLATGVLVSLSSGDSCVLEEAHRKVTDGALRALADHHEANPLVSAMPKEALQSSLGRPPDALLEDVLLRLADDGRIVVASEGVRLPEHEVRLSEGQERSLAAMVDLARRGRFAPPSLAEVLERAGATDAKEARALFDIAVARGDLVVVGEHVYHRECLGDLAQLVRDHVREKGPFTIAQLRDLTGSSRKYVVPLAEYLDRTGLTRRQGDLRTLAE
jgi:selenocysteine-specific elongation factor